jgi:RNA polymerase sigma factor (sigma-70 family)
MSASLAASFAKVAGRPYAGVETDRELIARFHQTRDEAAFKALVDKHGPMVLGVCQRKLRDAHSADDAFQATFLILAKKAGAVRWHENLAGWLYRVAMHVCAKAHTKLSRHAAQPMLEADAVAKEEAPASDLSAVLDQELNALPASYREPILLCHLQGYTVEEAAKLLNTTDGQLRGRLFRGREKLRERLAKRGVALSLTALVVSLTSASAQALPLALRTATVQSVFGGTVSIALQSLVNGGLSAMSNFKLKLIVASVLVCGGLITTGVVTQQAGAQALPSAAVTPNNLAPATLLAPANAKVDDGEKKDEPKKQIDRRHGKIKSIDAAKNEFVVTLNEEKFDLPVFLDAKAKVLFGKKSCKLADYKVGMDMEISYEGETKNPFEVKASWPNLETIVKGVDAAKKTINIRAEGNNGFEFEVPLSVAEDVEVYVDALPAGIADLATGKKIWVEFGLDKKIVEKIETEAAPDELSATFKAMDDKTVTLTIQVAGHRDQRKIDLKFPLGDKVAYRLSGKDITAKELLANMPVRVRFADNRQTVTNIWAGPVGTAKEDD